MLSCLFPLNWDQGRTRAGLLANHRYSIGENGHRLGGRTDSIVNVMRKTYVPNSWILICPITAKSFGRLWNNYADPARFADLSPSAIDMILGAVRNLKDLIDIEKSFFLF